MTNQPSGRSPSSQPNGANVAWAMIGAVLSASVILFAQNGHFALLPESTSYTDLAAVLLAAVGVLVAVFGGVLAVLALWGFRHIKTSAIDAAADAGAAELKEQIENGPLRDYIEGEIGRLTTEILASAEFETRLRDRVDEAAFGSRRDRQLDEEEQDEREG